MEQMYCISRRKHKKDRIKILILGIVIGISIGIITGFLWGVATIENIIRTGLIQVPQRMGAIPF